MKNKKVIIGLAAFGSIATVIGVATPVVLHIQGEKELSDINDKLISSGSKSVAWYEFFNAIPEGDKNVIDISSAIENETLETKKTWFTILNENGKEVHVGELVDVIVVPSIDPANSNSLFQTLVGFKVELDSADYKIGTSPNIKIEKENGKSIATFFAPMEDPVLLDIAWSNENSATNEIQGYLKNVDSQDHIDELEDNMAAIIQLTNEAQNIESINFDSTPITPFRFRITLNFVMKDGFIANNTLVVRIEV